jgi:HD-GYP domain-containing protein (c-di-GMP phosphodiesterase class II)
MLKKINVDDARLGMYIHEICGSWMDHPFWKKSFKLTAAGDLKTLKACGIRELWIDTGRGLDVESGAAGLSQEEELQKVESALQQAVSSRPELEPRVSLQEEVERARKIHARAKQEVISMFQEARMGKALQMEQAADLADEINQSIARNAGALLSLARLKNKDDYTYLHSVAVCALMIALGRQFGIEGDTLRELGVAGLLHDVGKMMIPDEVLNKPGRLTDQEFDIVKDHPLRGWEMLKMSPGVTDTALDVCRHHHERIDGKGYPDRISGEALTFFARMGAVCDVYDAITSDRCYKKGWTPGESIRKMVEWKDGHFDDRVFQAFVKTVGIYPAGSLVRLRSGRLGVVIDQTEKSLLTPLVKVFFSSKAQAHIAHEVVDLTKGNDSIVNVEDPVEWGFDLNQMFGL